LEHVRRVASARNSRNTLRLKPEGIKQQEIPERGTGRLKYIEMGSEISNDDDSENLERDNQFQVTILVSVFKN
jgi:hypothetical protein